MKCGRREPRPKLSGGSEIVGCSCCCSVALMIVMAKAINNVKKKKEEETEKNLESIFLVVSFKRRK